MAIFVAVFLCLFAACVPSRVTPDPSVAAIADPEKGPLLELVESAPLETTLDHADVRNAQEVWLQMIAAAQKSIDLSQFYVVGGEVADSPLEPVLRALQAAVRRKVRVRFLVDAAMSATYPAELARIEAAGIELRRIDLRPLTGGVQH